MKLDPETEARIRQLAGLPPVDHGMPEDEFQRRVIAAAQKRNWLVAFFRPVRITRPDGGVRWETPVGADGRGWPDLVLVRHRVLYRELKTDKGELRPDQVKWIDRLREGGADAGVWRPSMWDEIMETLK